MPDLATVFRDPPARFSPAPIWWWSGDRLDPARLRWQLERLVEGGVHSVVVLNLAPSGPLFGSDPDDPPFRSEAWWAIFQQVCRDARDLGVFLWFYDQIGFSGAELQAEVVRANPAFTGQWLARLVQETEEPLELRCPGGGVPLAACALPLDGAGRPVGPPIPLPLDGESVHWPGGDRGKTRQTRQRHRVMLFYAVDRGFDYFQPAACRALFDQVHGQFEARLGEFFGSVIVGSFQDELPSMPTWGRAFASEFQRRYGYDLREQLVHLWEDLGPESASVRLDYHTLRAELAEAAFFRPLFEWHERHGLLCGFDQQGTARAGHPIQAIDLYADYLRTHRWYSAPGSDHHGEAKIHASLAHLYGRPRVWLEAFHSSGWGGTLEETFDWLLPWLRAGATLYDPHAVYYSTHGGWWEWAPPSTCWRQPYWRHYHQFATAITRLCAVLSEGTHLCDIGVLYPTATVQAGLRLDGPTDEARAAHDTYLALVGSMHWNKPAPGILDQDRRDFDVLDDASIQRATVEEGALAIRSERYRAIILPACRTLQAATARTLVRFVQAGGLLVAVGTVPAHAAGRQPSTADQEAVAALAALFREELARLVATAEEVPQALIALPRLVEAPVPVLVRRSGAAMMVFVPATFPGATRQHPSPDPRQAVYDFDAARYARELVISVNTAEASGLSLNDAPELWELSTGHRRSLPARREGRAIVVSVPFDDAPAALVVWGAGADDRAASNPAGRIEARQPASSPPSSAPQSEERSAAPLPATPSGERVQAVDEAAERAPEPSAIEARGLVIKQVVDQAAERALELSGPWEVELVPTLDNRWGDLDWPPAPGAPPVQRWTFQYRRELPGEDGLATGWMLPAPDESGAWPESVSRGWEEVHATFGIQGWWCGPAQREDLPAPHTGWLAGPTATSKPVEPPDQANSLVAAGWQPAVYSLSRGILRDPLHVLSLGPKGHVPEEFLDFGTVPAGSAVQYRTAFWFPAAASLMLAIGGAAAKEAWFNGYPLGSGGAGYLSLWPVQVAAGWNVLEFRLVAEESATLRAYFALVKEVEAFRRPEWLTPGDGATLQTAHSVLRFERTLAVAAQPRNVRLQLAVDAPARLLVNGREIARQGGFDPYGHQRPARLVRIRAYDLTEAFRAGLNAIAVEVLDAGRPCAVLVDALVVDAAGQRTVLISDETWNITRDGQPVPLALRRRQERDPAWAHLWRRPHPLPDAAWLEGEPPEEVVVPLRPDPWPRGRRVEWLRFRLPPGAQTMRLPLDGDVEEVAVFVDGQRVPAADGVVWLPPAVPADTEPADAAPGGRAAPKIATAAAAQPAAPHTPRLCAVRLVRTTGGLGGALLRGPVTFGVGRGWMEPGSWETQGLAGYSGGVAYRRCVELAETPAQTAAHHVRGQRIWLDLGRVRGTAEVWVNGASAGSRVWSPYRFDATALVRPGVNTVEVHVFNTLAPYLAAVSPTPYVFPGQLVSGLLGPVRLLYTASGAEHP